MTGPEFLKQFDILYNNISSSQAPGLTDEEIESFLNQAQEELVVNLYKGTVGDAFETTEEVTRYLSSLIKTKEYTLSDITATHNGKYSQITLPSDLLFVIYQSFFKGSDNPKERLITPVKNDSLFKELNNPFKGKSKSRALATYEESKMIIYKHITDINSIFIKYISLPTKIDTSKGTDACSLPEILHYTIIMQAVQKAKLVWQM